MSNNKIEIKKLTAKTEGQKEYIRAIKSNDLIFCTGPAGTGKTSIALAMAVQALDKGEVEKIVLIRPQVEARERTGYLPGGMDEKYSPYLMAANEELAKWADDKKLRLWEDQKKIQRLQIAYSRGINLHNCFIIVEEAQNVTYHQFKLLLTRIGQDSKMIISGDGKQSDLFSEKAESLHIVMSKLKEAEIEGVAFVKLTIDDIVRSDLVGQIIRALEQE